MGRIQARDCGFKLIFEYLFKKDLDMESVFDENESLTAEDKEFANQIFDIAKTNLDDINSIIISNLKENLKLSDIYKLDYAILVSAIAQIDYLKEPLSLIINESVNLAKKYSTDNSPKFINGVLGSIYGKTNN